MKNGLLLINLGTPDAPTLSAVRRYLREFLSDRRVIELPDLLRYVLLYGLILPFRAPKTTQAYQAIWAKEGSPLRFYSQQLEEKLQQRLGETCTVAMGMRYGNPSLSQALQRLSSCDRITIIPLYPQYSSAATGSVFEYIFNTLKARPVFPHLHFVRDFYHQPEFIQAQAEQIRPHLNDHEHILFSYHGLPEQHLMTSGCNEVCKTDCPLPEQSGKTTCYRAQCFDTSRRIAQSLNLTPDTFSTSFQSRLGRTPWITPYTDVTLTRLRDSGIKNLAVACPSFVTDCLETLEEIGIRAKKQWLALGGEKFTLIPALNAHDLWIDSLEKMITKFAI